jgi:hypothetical protein
MRRDPRDLSSARVKIGPLLAAGPWRRDVLVLTPRSRCRTTDRAGAGRHHAYPRTGPAQPDDRSSWRCAPTPSPSALVNIAGGTRASGVFFESGAETADCRRGSWIRRPERRPQLARKPIDVASNSEASVIIFHDGWYYLLVTDGACGAGANSSCNIRIGRSRKVTGPFVDTTGLEMLSDGETCSADT